MGQWPEQKDEESLLAPIPEEEKTTSSGVKEATEDTALFLESFQDRRKGFMCRASLWLTVALAATVLAVEAVQFVRANTAAVAVIDEIDAGLRELRDSGDWFQVVARYLTAP